MSRCYPLSDCNWLLRLLTPAFLFPVLLSIHRAFFAQAIIDCPDNPLRSQFAPSFLAAYRASCTILKAINDQFTLLPTLCARFWIIWTYAFSAAVVFGTVVTRGPRSPLATQAVAQLDIACELFTKAAKLSRRAAKALVCVYFYFVFLSLTRPSSLSSTN